MVASSLAIETRVAETEARLFEAKKVREAQKDRVTVTLPFPSNRRQYVVGPGGGVRRKLLQEYCDVRVTMPPLTD